MPRNVTLYPVCSCLYLWIFTPCNKAEESGIEDAKSNQNCYVFFLWDKAQNPARSLALCQPTSSLKRYLSCPIFPFKGMAIAQLEALEADATSMCLLEKPAIWHCTNPPLLLPWLQLKASLKTELRSGTKFLWAFWVASWQYMSTYASENKWWIQAIQTAPPALVMVV